SPPLGWPLWCPRLAEGVMGVLFPKLCPQQRPALTLLGLGKEMQPMLRQPSYKLSRWALPWGVGIWLTVLAVSQAAADQIYFNDFQGAVGPEWSSQQTSIPRVGARRFLGDFDNGTVSLTLNNLPQHLALTVSFDLFIIRSWDGNDPGFGPDVWQFGIGGGPTLLTTTFTNIDFPVGGAPDGRRQAYPGMFPGGDFPARTGAVENNTLGYTFFFSSIGA